MYKFTNLTKVNGINYKNLESARQNQYCWSMSELGDYIYVGTSRNMVPEILKIFLGEDFKFPTSLDSSNTDNRAEIWRYKKDGSSNWQKVFKVNNENEYGFRYMVNFKPVNGNPAIYAASAVTKGYMQVYKSVNGTVWKPVLSDVKEDSTIIGTSSRAMVVHNGKLYLAAVSESGLGRGTTLLYSSKDPEFYPWKLETPANTDPKKNHQGALTNMAVFNNHIYVSVSSDDGVQIWRTNGIEPKVNDWKLVVDKGFGDKDNKFTLSMGVFQEHLYVSGTKDLPLSWMIPRGCDIVRIDKDDNYEVVVGPESISRTYSGFNNPFNIYAWQIQEHDGLLYITTMDASTNMELVLNLILANKEKLKLPEKIISIIEEIYEIVVRVLNLFKYPFGFNLYVSENGEDFYPVFLDGFKNRYNYGGRILYVDDQDNFYIGTANPVEGLEVWKRSYSRYDFDIAYDYCEYLDMLDVDFEEIREKLEEDFEKLEKYIPQIREFFSR